MQSSVRTPPRATIAALLSAGAVMLLYFFFSTNGRMAMPEPAPYPVDYGIGYYANLADGWLSGRLSMAAEPDARLAAMEDPWNADARREQGINYIWDASYFRGRYYLYFSALPVLTFYLPYKVVTGAAAPDAAAGFFFASLAIAGAALFIARAVPRRPFVVALWVLFAGLTNLVAFHALEFRIYEVAIVAGAACSAWWAVALQRFVDVRTARAAVWLGLLTGLCFAARPNLLVLLLPTALAFLRIERAVLLRLVRAATIPFVLVVIVVLLHNAARFGKPKEFGERYQMTFSSMEGVSVCSLCSTLEFGRAMNNFMQYQFATPHVWAKFPFLEPPRAHVDPEMYWNGEPEEIVGVFALAPLGAFASIAAALAFFRRTSASPAVRSAHLVMLGAWIVLASLSTCWWIVSRYTIDFAFLFAASSAVVMEDEWEQMRRDAGRHRFFRTALVLLALYSIVAGALLGFEGRYPTMRGKNRELHHAVGTALGAEVR